MKRWLKRGAMAALFVGLAAGTYFLGYRAGANAMKPPEQRTREADFVAAMAGVTLNGSFTIDGRESDSLAWERYTIERVEPLAGDFWTFHARMEFGDTDVTLPVPVRVVWADDTPMVSLTDAAIPGLGTFTVRLLFYGDHYAGMWSNPSTGGLQFGRIERQEQ